VVQTLGFITHCSRNNQRFYVGTAMRACLLLSLAFLGAALRHPRTSFKDEVYGIEETNYALAHGKPIFYQIVMGSFPFRKQYKLWLGALRQVGKYDGTIMIVTDKAGCIENGLGKDLLGGDMLPESDKNVNIYPGTGTGKIHILKVKTPQSVLGIKMHKGKAWSNLKLAKVDHAVSSIVYTDTDVIVAKDVNHWLAYAKSLETKKFTLALFPDLGQLEDFTQNLHTGVVVMFPTKASQICIQAWSRQLGGGSDDPAPIHHFGNSLLQDGVTRKEKKMLVKGVDQQALGRTAECHDHGTGGVKKMPKSYLSFPNGQVLNQGKTTVFMHITNTGQWKKIGDEVKKTFFYKKLGISQDIDFLTKGSCAKEMWDTTEYRKLNEKK